MSKFHNVVTEVDGFKFASKKEARRYGELRLLERAGKLSDLKVQPRFPLSVNGHPVCAYVGDFQYVQPAGSQRIVVEDVKSEITRKHPVYRIKNKLFKALMGFEITEV